LDPLGNPHEVVGSAAAQPAPGLDDPLPALGLGAPDGQDAFANLALDLLGLGRDDLEFGHQRIDSLDMSANGGVDNGCASAPAPIKRCSPHGFRVLGPSQRRSSVGNWWSAAALSALLSRGPRRADGAARLSLRPRLAAYAGAEDVVGVSVERWRPVP